MDNITYTSAAALRSRSESSFTVPSGNGAGWHLAVRNRAVDSALGNARSAMTGIAIDVPTGNRSANVGPMGARDVRTTTKQARPPREVRR